jgi:hypothetical protein
MIVLSAFEAFLIYSYFVFYFRISIKVKDYFWFEAFIVIVQTGTSTILER